MPAIILLPFMYLHDPVHGAVGVFFSPPATQDEIPFMYYSLKFCNKEVDTLAKGENAHRLEE